MTDHIASDESEECKDRMWGGGRLLSFRIYKKQYGLAIQYFDIFANYLQKIALFYFLRTKMFFFLPFIDQYPTTVIFLISTYIC